MERTVTSGLRYYTVVCILKILRPSEYESGVFITRPQPSMWMVPNEI